MFQTTYYQILRSLHKTCTLMTKKRAMPGLRHQLNAFENATDLADDPESFEEMESDFMHLNKTHHQHEAELRAQQDRVRHIMVKNKYFRDQRLPNLLFYAEKEEMRSLHTRDPDEWTFERLAESFPATPEIVKKVVKGQWRPYSTKRIREHDEAVIKNWECVKNDDKDMFLPAEVREHLLKFAARTSNHTSTDQAIIPKLPTPKRTEFSSIITSCKKYAEKPKAFNGEKMNPFASKREDLPDPENETYLLNKVHDKRRMRLEEWQKENIQHFEQLEDGLKKQPTNDESEIIVTPENPSGTGYIEKFESNEIVISAEDSKRYEMSTYKEQIHIPRKLWRRGGTYRIEDCYYDDDGEFLYRVPGMSGGTQHMESKKSNSSKYK